MNLDRGSLEHRMVLASRVRLKLALATAELDSSPRSCVILRVVLGELLRRADVRGICWPSCQRMAFDVELARSSVNKAVATLVQIGVITRTQGKPKPGSKELRSTRYHLNWDRLDELAQVKSVVNNTAPDVQRSARTTGAQRPYYGRSTVRTTGRNVSIEHTPHTPHARTSRPVAPQEREGEAPPPAPAPSPTHPPTRQRAAEHEPHVSFVEAMRLLRNEQPELIAKVGQHVDLRA